MNRRIDSGLDRRLIGTAPAEADFLRGYVGGGRANIALYTGDLAACATYGAQVLRLLPETEVIARTTARLHMSRVFRVTGDVTVTSERRAIALTTPDKRLDRD